ncbi:hypothetical protein Taro_049659 [Colocasia esculenta]|uniref:Diacylglycerol O-acyltransferase n=1 Tax=Colocasia esculenta TaxID=4460 RepID=A0A843XBQ1_COLES|nr:hypothetical protein [Colocasia esculenta]
MQGSCSGQDGLRCRKGDLVPLSISRTSKLSIRREDKEEEEVVSLQGKVRGEEAMVAQMPTEEEEEPMSPAARLFRQPRFNCFIIATMGFAKRIDVDVVKAGLEATLVRHPRFSSVQVFDGGSSKWVRTKVALEDHLVLVSPDTDAVASPDIFVEDYIAGLTRKPLTDDSRPLWDLHILNLRTTDAEAVVVFRIHHSLGDGISLMSLLLACARKASDPEALPSLPGGGGGGRRLLPAGNVSDSRGWCARVLAILVGLCAALRMAWNTVVDVLLFVATSAFLRDTKTPVKGTEGAELRPKRFVRRSLSLADVKSVKNAAGSTINDVLLAVTTAGLTRYLSRRYEGESDDGKGKRQILPKNIRFRSTVLVNLRPSPGIHALADMMEEGNNNSRRWGNWLGYIIIPFSISKREDPLEYMRVAKAIADRKKCSLEAIFTYASASLLVKIFGVKVACALSHRVLSHTSFSFSNVVGPVEEVAFFGHPMVYLAPSVHGHPHALTVHFQSYMDKMELVVAVDETAIPDPHRLCEDFAESLNQMKDAADAIRTTPQT